jgi:hypothetical protein
LKEFIKIPSAICHLTIGLGAGSDPTGSTVRSGSGSKQRFGSAGTKMLFLTGSLVVSRKREKPENHAMFEIVGGSNDRLRLTVFILLELHASIFPDHLGNGNFEIILIKNRLFVV